MSQLMALNSRFTQTDMARRYANVNQVNQVNPVTVPDSLTPQMLPWDTIHIVKPMFTATTYIRSIAGILTANPNFPST